MSSLMWLELCLCLRECTAVGQTKKTHVCTWAYSSMRTSGGCLLRLISLSVYLSVVAVAPSPSWPWPPFPHAVPVLPPIPPHGKLCNGDGSG